MGEETQNTEVGTQLVMSAEAVITGESAEKPDLTLFRKVQREIGGTAENKELFNEVVNEDIKTSIGNDGKVDKALLNTVEEYKDIVKEPYSVDYYMAGEIFNVLTEDNFETIDKYILDKIKSSNQKTTFEVYDKILKALENVLSLSDDHNTMHRIVTVAKFIKHGT